jgi:hypothetical protein
VGAVFPIGECYSRIMKQEKIIIGPMEIAGWHLNLFRGLKSLNVDVTYCCVHSNTSGLEDAPPDNILISMLRYSSKNHFAGNGMIRWIWAVMHYITRLLIFVWSCIKFNTYIYVFGTPYVHKLELCILRLLRKRIIVVFHGSDTRPPFIDGGTITVERMSNLAQCVKKNATIRNNVLTWEKYATCICSPTCGQFFTKPFVNWHLALGMPFQLPENGEIHSLSSDVKSKRIRILHCPSYLIGKGTAGIREIINNIKAKGYDFDFIELHGKPHSEVMKELRKCTFAIDQLYSDLAFSGYGCEAAHHGKIALVAGYAQKINDSIAKVTGMPMDHYCRPEELENLVEECIKNQDLAKTMGENARNFVTTVWSNGKIAERMLAIIENKLPASWYVDPMTIDYVEGGGMPIAEIKRRYTVFVEKCGIGSFLMSDKQLLTNKISQLVA